MHGSLIKLLTFHLPCSKRFLATEKENTGMPRESASVVESGCSQQQSSLWVQGDPTACVYFLIHDFILCPPSFSSRHIFLTEWQQKHDFLFSFFKTLNKQWRHLFPSGISGQARLEAKWDGQVVSGGTMWLSASSGAASLGTCYPLLCG